MEEGKDGEHGLINYKDTRNEILFARLNLSKKLGTRLQSKKIYVVYRKPAKYNVGKSAKQFLTKKSANWGFLTLVSTAVQ